MQAFNVNTIAVDDHEEYDITLRGMDIKRLVQLISDNAQSQGGFIHRSAVCSKHEPFHAIVQTDGDTDDMIHNETILRALQDAEEQKERTDEPIEWNFIEDLQQ
jgi:hypothetical protein